MNVKFILLTIIILIVIYAFISYEHLTYDENTFMTLQAQQAELETLNNQYDNSIPEDERITNDIDKRDKMLYFMSF
jgi:hypothetical protein